MLRSESQGFFSMNLGDFLNRLPDLRAMTCERVNGIGKVYLRLFVFLPLGFSLYYVVRLMYSRQDQWRDDALLIMFCKRNRGRLTDHCTYGVSW